MTSPPDAIDWYESLSNWLDRVYGTGGFMSITDELRKWAKDNTLQDMVLTTYPPQHAVHGVLETLLRIADRIDAEHEEAIQQALMGEGGVPATDENMAEYGWMRLPKDADGEYIHIGDVMEGKKIGGGYGEPFEVVGYVMSNGELEPMDEHRNPRKRKYSRHHHAPTVEDVLREMADRCYADEGEPRDRDAIVAEYAAKLRLADDAE